MKSEREEVAPTEMSKSEDENNSDGKVSVAKADSLKAVAPKAEKKVANMLPSTGDSNGVALMQQYYQSLLDQLCLLMVLVVKKKIKTCLLTKGEVKTHQRLKHRLVIA
ncbi:hypothetical protein NC01_06645 [Streptococcus uberis]|nr:hypothetical protein NC01_06645 [Streptococcus uberis]